MSYGVGVEKVFPVHAPSIEKIETVRHGKVRRAKLYYLRDRVGKSAKIKRSPVIQHKKGAVLVPLPFYTMAAGRAEHALRRREGEDES